MIMSCGDQFLSDLWKMSDKIRRLLKGQRTVVSVLFPFGAFFADAPQPLFPAESYESDMEIAEGCFRLCFVCYDSYDCAIMWRCDKHR